MRTKEQFLEIIEQAKELHLEAVEMEGIKYYLGSTSKLKLLGPVEEQKPEDIVKPLSSFEELTDEEVLYYSSPYYDVLKAEKEAKTKQKQQDDELKEEIK